MIARSYKQDQQWRKCMECGRFLSDAILEKSKWIDCTTYDDFGPDHCQKPVCPTCQAKKVPA